MLKIFSIVGLYELEELPILQEGAIPLLQTFIIVECSALKVFPKSYSDLKTLQTIKIYGCSSMIMENLREIQESNRMIEVTRMSVEDTRESRKRYSELMEEMKSWLYGEFWSNDVFLFLEVFIQLHDISCVNDISCVIMAYIMNLCPLLVILLWETQQVHLLWHSRLNGTGDLNFLSLIRC